MSAFEDPFDDLDRLVSELDLLERSGRTAAAMEGLLEMWLARVRDADGSDLLLVAGAPPVIRADGRLIRISDDPLAGDDIEAAVHPVVAPRLQQRYRAGDAVELAFKLGGLGRFRMNLHRERGRAAAAIRALPMRVPQLADLHFTHDIGVLTTLARGLVLVGGRTGAGKTTTLAALIAAINERDAHHILTVEDPIEYEHPHGRSIVEQVEIGLDAADFPSALRAALRHAPDVIVIGEMRDAETMRLALAAAAAGHLVFAAVDATDAAAAVSRIADAFPAGQNAGRQELAMALAAVLTQTLVPARRGGVVPIAELLMVSDGTRLHVRENTLQQHLNQEIALTRRAGSFSFEESLARSVRTGLLDRDDAMLRAHHQDAFDSLLTGQ